jgi:hypothetical protein
LRLLTCSTSMSRKFQAVWLLTGCSANDWSESRCIGLLTCSTSIHWYSTLRLITCSTSMSRSVVVTRMFNQWLTSKIGNHHWESFKEGYKQSWYYVFKGGIEAIRWRHTIMKAHNEGVQVIEAIIIMWRHHTQLQINTLNCDDARTTPVKTIDGGAYAHEGVYWYINSTKLSWRRLLIHQ